MYSRETFIGARHVLKKTRKKESNLKKDRNKKVHVVLSSCLEMNPTESREGSSGFGLSITCSDEGRTKDKAWHDYDYVQQEADKAKKTHLFFADVHFCSWCSS